MSAETDPEAFRPPRFDVAVEAGDTTTTLKVAGELDLVSEPQLNQALEDASGAGQPLTVDLSDLGFIDSTGLRALLSAARTYPGLTLHGPLQAPVQRLLDLTQTLAILPFTDNQT